LFPTVVATFTVESETNLTKKDWFAIGRDAVLVARIQASQAVTSHVETLKSNSGFVERLVNRTPEPLSVAHLSKKWKS
jgi:hypothetical protein